VADLHVNGIRLYYEERGDGNPILGIHGTGSSALMWEEAADELSRLGRVITYDRRGCTRSERPEPYPTTSVAEHTDDAAALLQTIGATPAILIGRSYGGGVAIDLAIRYPDHVQALVLLEAGILALSRGADRWWWEVTERVRAAAARDVERVGETLIRAVLGDAGWEGMSEELKTVRPSSPSATAGTSPRTPPSCPRSTSRPSSWGRPILPPPSAT